MGVVTKPKWRVSDAQLRQAEQSTRRWLAKRGFSRKWMDEHMPEVMSAARTDLAVRLAAESVNETVGLLVIIAYRRALKMRDRERTRPVVSSLEEVFHLADEKTLTPEEETLRRERQMRLVKAIGLLPERERKLLALVYYDEVPLGEAGRRLGWAKASATRHHQAALERLKAIIGERNLIAGEIAVPAYIAAGHHSPLRAAVLWIGGAVESAREAVLLGAGRLAPLADTGNAAALGGGGRAVGGVCAVAVGACLVAATGVVGPGIVALGGSGEHRAPPPRRAAEVLEPAGGGREASTSPGQSTGLSHPSSAASSKRTSTSATVQAGIEARTPTRRRSRSAEAAPPKATTKQTINEFGVEQGEGGSESSTGSSGEPSAAARVAPSTTSVSSSSSSQTFSGSQSRPGSPSGSAESGSEFGM